MATGSEERGPIPDIAKQVLRDNYIQILKSIKPDVLLIGNLYQHGVISWDEKVCVEQKKGYEAVVEIITIVHDAGPDGFTKFIKSLRGAKYTGLAQALEDYLEKKKKAESTPMSDDRSYVDQVELSSEGTSATNKRKYKEDLSGHNRKIGKKKLHKEQFGCILKDEKYICTFPPLHPYPSFVLTSANSNITRGSQDNILSGSDVELDTINNNESSDPRPFDKHLIQWKKEKREWKTSKDNWCKQMNRWWAYCSNVPNTKKDLRDVISKYICELYKGCRMILDEYDNEIDYFEMIYEIPHVVRDQLKLPKDEVLRANIKKCKYDKQKQTKEFILQVVKLNEFLYFLSNRQLTIVELSYVQCIYWFLWSLCVNKKPLEANENRHKYKSDVLLKLKPVIENLSSLELILDKMWRNCCR